MGIPVSSTDNQIQMDLDAMPKFRKDELCKATLSLVDAVFSIPGEEERYQEWLRARKEASRER